MKLALPAALRLLLYCIVTSTCPLFAMCCGAIHISRESNSLLVYFEFFLSCYANLIYRESKLSFDEDESHWKNI